MEHALINVSTRRTNPAQDSPAPVRWKSVIIAGMLIAASIGFAIHSLVRTRNDAIEDRFGTRLNTRSWKDTAPNKALDRLFLELGRQIEHSGGWRNLTHPGQILWLSRQGPSGMMMGNRPDGFTPHEILAAFREIGAKTVVDALINKTALTTWPNDEIRSCQYRYACAHISAILPPEEP